MDNSKYQPNDQLGVNKLGKNIRKSPLHQPSFTNNATKQQPLQPHVYNVSKNDFRNVVQQLTGSSSQSQELLPRPPQNPPKPQSQRLQKIKPPPLTPVNSPLIPPQASVQVAAPAPAPAPIPPPVSLPPQAAESPISAYMRYLQTYIMDPSPVRGQVQPQPQPQSSVPDQSQTQPPSSGLLPNPPMPPFPSPRGVNGHLTPIPNILSPRMNGPALLPSPASLFLLPSPTGYPNFLSSRSPYPLPSPGVQFPSMTPRFPFSPRPHPRWRDH
ncbi:hypothetical protein SLA2020_092280 [Shorea laevis]